MLQVCVNGARGAADGAMVPLAPQAMAEAVVEAVEAGAADVHVHPKTPCGRDSVSPRVVAATLEAIRARVSVPVGVTTGAWAEPDRAARSARVRSWTVLPDHASVNWHEPGAEELAAALIDLGVGVEAGIWSGTDGAARFARSPLGPKVLRVLAEVTDPTPGTAERTARALLAAPPAAVAPTADRCCCTARTAAHGRCCGWRGGWGRRPASAWRTPCSCRTGNGRCPTLSW